MDAATIARVMSAIPERAAWMHSGTAFAAHDAQGAQLLYLAKFLQWMSPLTVLTKDDQRALGLLAAHQRPVEDEAELDEALDPQEAGGLEQEAGAPEEGVEVEGEPDGDLGELEEVADDFDPDATLPPPPAREEEHVDVYATTDQTRETGPLSI